MPCLLNVIVIYQGCSIELSRHWPTAIIRDHALYSFNQGIFLCWSSLAVLFQVIWLEFLLRKERVVWLVSVNKYLDVGVARDHTNSLVKLITSRPQIFSQLVEIFANFFEIKLDKVYMLVISFLNTVENRLILEIKVVNCQVEFRDGSQVFFLSHLCFNLLLL